MDASISATLPPPRLVYAEPIVIQHVPAGVVRQPDLICTCAAGHAKNWRSAAPDTTHAASRSTSCKRLWYNDVYVAHYGDVGYGRTGAPRPARGARLRISSACPGVLRSARHVSARRGRTARAALLGRASANRRQSKRRRQCPRSDRRCRHRGRPRASGGKRSRQGRRHGRRRGRRRSDRGQCGPERRTGPTARTLSGVPPSRAKPARNTGMITHTLPRRRASGANERASRPNLTVDGNGVPRG